MNETTSTYHYKTWKTQALKGWRCFLNNQWGKFNCFHRSFSPSCITRSRTSAGTEHHRTTEDASHRPSICCQQFSKTAHSSMYINWAVVDVFLMFQLPFGAGMTQNQSFTEHRGEKPCKCSWVGWEPPRHFAQQNFALQSAKRRCASSLVAGARRKRMQEIQFLMQQHFSDICHRWKQKKNYQDSPGKNNTFSISAYVQTQEHLLKCSLQISPFQSKHSKLTLPKSIFDKRRKTKLFIFEFKEKRFKMSKDVGEIRHQLCLLLLCLRVSTPISFTSTER